MLPPPLLHCPMEADFPVKHSLWRWRMNGEFRSIRTRILDIAIASLIGGIFGAVISSGNFHPGFLSVDTLFAKKILVDGNLGTVSIRGDDGIRLDRHDYATAGLLFHEPGTGSPGKGGPALWICGLEHQAFKASPSGQEIVHFKHDDRDGQ